VECLEDVRGGSEAHEGATRQVENVARDLLVQAETLREQVRRFQVK
jgi:hypothetical protein